MRRLPALVVALALVVPGTGTASSPALAGVWIPTFPAYAIAGHLSAFPDGTAYAWVDSPGAGAFLRSSDFGLTWSALPGLPPLAGVPKMGTVDVGYSIWDGPCTLLLCPNIVYRTRNGGLTWLPAKPLPNATGQWQQVSSAYGVAPDGRTVVVPAERAAWNPACEFGHAWPERTEIFVTRDGARNWEHRHLPVRGSVISVKMLDARHGVLNMDEVEPKSECFGEGHRDLRSSVWVTDDGARTWRRTSVRCDSQCISVAMPSPRRLVVGSSWGAVHVSTDGGRTFRPPARLTPGGADPRGTPPDGLPAVWDISFAGPSVGYAITMGGGIWRTGDGGQTWLLEPSPAHTRIHMLYRIAAADAAHGVALHPFGLLTRVAREATMPDPD